MLGAGLQRVGPLCGKMPLVVGKIAAVGLKRIVARSALRGERIEKPQP